MATQLEKSPAKQEEAPTLWSPWPDMNQIRSEMMDMMNGMFRRHWMGQGQPFGEAASTLFSPALKLYKQDKNLIAELAVPGLDRKNINLNVTRDTLSISGEYKKEDSSKKDQVFHSEIHYGSFQRSVRLPVEVDANHVKAELKDGILSVTMPMANPERHQQVKIDVK